MSEILNYEELLAHSKMVAESEDPVCSDLHDSEYDLGVATYNSLLNTATQFMADHVRPGNVEVNYVHEEDYDTSNQFGASLGIWVESTDGQVVRLGASHEWSDAFHPFGFSFRRYKNNLNPESRAVVNLLKRPKNMRAVQGVTQHVLEQTNQIDFTVYDGHLVSLLGADTTVLGDVKARNSRTWYDEKKGTQMAGVGERNPFVDYGDLPRQHQLFDLAVQTQKARGEAATAKEQAAMTDVIKKSMQGEDVSLTETTELFKKISEIKRSKNLPQTPAADLAFRHNVHVDLEQLVSNIQMIGRLASMVKEGTVLTVESSAAGLLPMPYNDVDIFDDLQQVMRDRDIQ